MEICRCQTVGHGWLAKLNYQFSATKCATLVLYYYDERNLNKHTRWRICKSKVHTEHDDTSTDMAVKKNN